MEKTLTLPKKGESEPEKPVLPKVVEAPKEKVKRTPVGGNRDILTVEGREEGWFYRWVLDIGNRTDKFKKAGYEFVTHDVMVGDARAGVPEGLGSIVEALSGNGGQKLVLMRIPMEYYQEDQDSKEAERKVLEVGMGKEIDGTYGHIGIGRK